MPVNVQSIAKSVSWWALTVSQGINNSIFFPKLLTAPILFDDPSRKLSKQLKMLPHLVVQLFKP